MRFWRKYLCFKFEPTEIDSSIEIGPNLKRLLFNLLTHRHVLQGHPTRNVFFEFDILGTYIITTIDLDTSNFSKHVDIWLFGR